MAIIKTVDADYYLQQWALWSVSGLQQNTGTLGVVGGSHLPTADITDDEAMLIDKLVCQLVQKDERQGKAVKYYYFTGKNLARTSERIKVNYKRTEVLVKSGVAWIDGVLDGLRYRVNQNDQNQS